jgi:hypothetical protein
MFAKGIDDLAQKDNAGYGNGQGQRVCNLPWIKKQYAQR